MKRPITNPAASIRAKLMNEYRSTGLNFDRILRRYAYERFLKRLELAGFSDRFVLKGAMLFVVWEESGFRPTSDLDLLGFGALSEDSVREIVTLATGVDISDGLIFESEFGVGPIREDQKYGGIRVRIRARLENAIIPLQIDIGIGDAVFPTPKKVEIPSLAGMPRPFFQVYPKEAVIAEKLHAMTDRGMLNSRLKDYRDISVLAKGNDFDGALLSLAILKTFERREMVSLTADLPGLTIEFAQKNQKPWMHYLEEIRETPVELEVVVKEISEFLSPPVNGLIRNGHFSGFWNRHIGSWENLGGSF